MAAERNLIQCTECKSWFDKEVNYTFSTPLFRYPNHWFFLWWTNHDREDASLCSWLCTKDFVDRMYAEHHPEDRKYGEKASYSDHQLTGSRDEESE